MKSKKYILFLRTKRTVWGLLFGIEEGTLRRVQVHTVSSAELWRSNSIAFKIIGTHTGNTSSQVKHVGVVGRIALFLRTSTSKFTTCIKAIIEAGMSEQSKGENLSESYVASREIAYTEA